MISLRRRLVGGHVIALALVLAVLEAFADHELRRELTDQFDAATRAKARALATLVESTGEGPELRFADENMPEFARTKDPEYFEVRRADGGVLERSPSLRGASLDLRADPAAAESVRVLTLPDGRPGRAVLLRFDAEPGDADERDGKPLAADAKGLGVVVARSSAKLHGDLLSLRLRLLVAGAALLVVGAAATSFLVRRGLAPLDRLAERAATIGPESLTDRFPAGDAPTELEPIRDRLNDLLARLESAFERERRFTADAAHELRTPIAELRAAAELAARHPDDPEAVAHALATAASSSARMERLVAHLLLLARTEAGHTSVEPVALDLVAAVEEAWAPHAAPAAARGLAPTLVRAAPVLATADPTLLSIVLDNLFSNVVAHAAAGPVRVEVAARGGAAEVRVRNAAPGLDGADVGHLFERFWRKDPARAQGTHAGVGLSVSLEVVGRLHGSLRAEMPEEGVLLLVLGLPAADAAGGAAADSEAPPSSGR